MPNVAKRVSRQERRHRVLQLKIAGGSDRVIVDVLARDLVAPTTVTHTTVNRDWHEALDELRETVAGQSEQLRMLANTRLERLLAAVWPKATQTNPVISAVDQARGIIKDQRALFGLDRELGDPERPLTLEERVTIDYSGLSNIELRTLLDLGERNVINGTGEVT